MKTVLIFPGFDETSNLQSANNTQKYWARFRTPTYIQSPIYLLPFDLLNIYRLGTTKDPLPPKPGSTMSIFNPL